MTWGATSPLYKPTSLPWDSTTSRQCGGESGRTPPPPTTAFVHDGDGWRGAIATAGQTWERVTSNPAVLYGTTYVMITGFTVKTVTRKTRPSAGEYSVSRAILNHTVQYALC